MDRHGAILLGDGPRLVRPTAFADPEVERMARIARDLDAKAAAQGYSQMVNWRYPQMVLPPTAFNTFTTAQAIMAAVDPFVPADSCSTGTTFHIHAWGTYGSAAGSATSTIGLFLNTASTVLAVTPSFTPPTSTVNLWHLDAYAVVLTPGASGTMQCAGHVLGLGATVTTPILMPATLPAAVTFNTQQANGFGVLASWSVSAAGNTYTVENLAVRQLN